MWWNWTEITLIDSILFSIISIAILYLVGWGTIKLIGALSKRDDPLSAFDFFQKMNFRIFFGFIFIVFFALIFSIFDFPFFVSALLIIAIAVTGIVVFRNRVKIELPKKPIFKNYAVSIIVFFILLLSIFLLSGLIAGFYGSTNDDGSDHTLMIRLILQNSNVLLTRIAQPYSHSILNYPTGAHVLCTFLLTLLNVPIQKIVIMVTVILPVLISLSFYSTIKCLFENKFLSILGLTVSAFFSIGLCWAPVGWAGLPLLLSLFISTSGIGLVFIFLHKQKINGFTALLIGLIFFISVQTYPGALLMVVLWSFALLSYKLITKLSNAYLRNFSLRSLFRRSNLFITFAFFVPILFSIPFLYFVFTQNGQVFQITELSSFASVSASSVKSLIGFNWLLDLPALSVFFSMFGKLFALVPISLIMLFVLLIPRISQWVSSIFSAKEFKKSLFLVYSLMLLIMGYLTLTLFLPINFLSAFFDPQRVWQHLYLPATILTAVVIFFVVFLSYVGFKRLFQSDRINLAKLQKNRILGCALLALLIFNVALISIPVITEQTSQYKKIEMSLNTYETLESDDLSLMKWISENVPSNEHVLVSAGDSGQFVSAVTQKLTVSEKSKLKDYVYLMGLLTSNASDSKIIQLMVDNNISYVYIGSVATTYALQYAYYRHFNATQLLQTSYFTPIKQVGDASLFQFNVSAALIAYDASDEIINQPQQQPLYSNHIDILPSQGGYTTPGAGRHYGPFALAISAHPDAGYHIDHWVLNGNCTLAGPDPTVFVDYANYTLQAFFTK